MMPSRVAVDPTAIHTRFGRFNAAEQAVIAFPEGLPGFERCRKFVLLSSDSIAPVNCLHGLDAPEPSFLCVDPSLVYARYRPVLSEADRARLGDHNDADLVWLAFVTLGAGSSGVVNLRAPVVINARRMTGLQTIQSRKQYRIAHPLRVG
jgi:flagellar assembly factor FliW